MSVVSALNILLGTDTTEFDKAMKVVEKKIYAFKHSLESGGGFIGNQLRNIVEKTFGSEAFHTAFEGLEHLAKVSERLDVPAEKLAGLRLAAEVGGQSFDDITGAMQKMLIAISGSGDLLEKGKAAKAFALLGITADELKGKNPGEQLGVIADGLKNVGDVADRVNIAKSIFGKGGVPMLNVLAEGSAGLEKWQKAAEESGRAFGKMDLKKIEEANIAIKLMWNTFKAITETITIALAPAIKGLANIARVVAGLLIEFFAKWGNVLAKVIEIMVAYKAITWAIVAAERAWAIVTEIRVAVQAKGFAQAAAQLGAIAGLTAAAVVGLEKAFSALDEKFKDKFKVENIVEPELGSLNHVKDALSVAMQSHPQLVLGGSAEAYTAIARGGAKAPLAKLEGHAKRTADNTDKLTKMKGQPILPAKQGGLR